MNSIVENLSIKFGLPIRKLLATMDNLLKVDFDAYLEEFQK